MSALIDVATAWKLISRVRDAQATGVPGASTAPVAIGADGSWSTKATVCPQAALLFDALLPLAVRSDYVVGQIGQSLDGRIATPTGQSHYITGEQSRIYLHRLRALADAVIVGATTIIVDDPALTVRYVVGSNPLRVVLDLHGRVPHERLVFHDGVPTWHVVQNAAVAAPNARPVVLGTTDPVTIPRALLEELARHGKHRVLVEGGSATLSGFLAAGCVDRLHVVVAPFLIGSGKPALVLPVINTLSEALHPRCRVYRLGDDLLYDLDLRAAASARPRDLRGNPNTSW